MIIPPPTYEEPELTLPEKGDDWYRNYLAVPSWKCPRCALVNFGRNKCCASCRLVKEMK